MLTIAARVEAAARHLCRDVARLRFGPPVTHVYNPLAYARRPHGLYVRTYGNSRKQVLFLGMKPAPSTPETKALDTNAG